MTDSDGSTILVASRNRPRLLPGMLGLIVINFFLSLVANLLSDTSVYLIALLTFLPITYIAWLMLRTRDLLQQPDRIHPADTWLMRWSGPLALLMLNLELGWASLAINLRQLKFLQPPAAYMFMLHFVEWGFLFSLLCLILKRPIEHLPPVLLWKVISVPLILIFGLEFVLWTIAPIAQ